MSFKEEYGPWAFVAGASEGLGEAYAKSLAKRGLNLVLMARGKEKLERTAGFLTNYNIEVKLLASDLANDDVLDTIDRETKDLDIGFMVYNAAYGPVRSFLANSVDQLEQHTNVNCRGPLLLSHYFGNRFKKRGKGGIILMSSLAGFQGTALVAPYAATKAFDTILGESLYYELKEDNVDVMVCAAGATKTPNYLSTEPKYGFFKPSEHDPNFVTEGALNSMGSGPLFIPGGGNRFVHALFRLWPRRKASSEMSKNMMKIYDHMKA